MEGRVRWKSKENEAIAKSEPMSLTMGKLRNVMIEGAVCGLLADHAVLVKADPELTGLLNRSCLGVPIISAPLPSLKGIRCEVLEDKPLKEFQWFQLSMVEAFYLCYSLKCLKIFHDAPKGNENLSNEELWNYMRRKQSTFLQHYKAYSHLRSKNWVVRSGLQYGVDFVAYHHHPTLVHSEYAVIVSSEIECKQTRLTTWSDWQSTLRLCGNVAKKLLVLSIIQRNQDAKEESPSFLENYIVEEFLIKRWLPEQHREDPPRKRREIE